MKIPEGEFKKGVELCFSNATSLIEDAQSLLQQKSFGHALFLGISAIEEISKAFMFACGRVEVWKSKDLFYDVRQHPSKYTLFVISILADATEKAIQTKEFKIKEPLELDDLVEIGKDLESVIKEIWNLRLQSLYVDYQRGNWLSPSDIKREDVEELLQYANKYKRKMELQCTNILKAPIDLAKQFQEYLDNQLFPWVSSQLQKKR